MHAKKGDLYVLCEAAGVAMWRIKFHEKNMKKLHLLLTAVVGK